MESFIDFLEQYGSVSSAAKTAIKQQCQFQEISKGESLLESGQVCDRIFYLVQGTLRTYFYQDGRDITYWIYPENTLVTSWHSYLTQTSSREAIEATEDSTILSMTFPQWQGWYADFPEMEGIARKFFEMQVVLLDDFYKGYYFLTAQQKYALLLKVFPDVTQRANVGHIATMLGISIETLSRVRSQ